MATNTAADNRRDSHTLNRAEARVNELGVPLPNKPADTADGLEWPENVAELGGSELAHHLTWWSGWASFVRYQLARADTNLAAFTGEQAAKKTRLMVKSKGDYKTVTEMKASVSQDEEIQRLSIRVLEAEAFKKMLEALLDGYEKKYATVSREISRRSSERDEGRAT